MRMNHLYHMERLCLRIKANCDSLLVPLYLRLSGCRVGRNLYACGWPHVANAGTIVIGAQVKLVSSHALNAVGGGRPLCLHTAQSGKLILEDCVQVSNTTIFAANEIAIRHHTLIGGGCAIYDTDFHELLPEDRHPRRRNVRTAPVSIGPHAFLGGHSIILKGITVGEGAVVGAGSVVTKDVPAFEVWAGNPARFIRKLESTLDPTRSQERS